MPDVVSTSNTVPLKIFIASSDEVKAEREECLKVFKHLRVLHPHLSIDTVDWNYNMPHTNYPDSDNIQDEINRSLLKDCPLVLFIFYSKIGKHTREEFQYAKEHKKRMFAYFKEGFSPKKDEIRQYEEVLDFKNHLEDIVLYEHFTELQDFKHKLTDNLNVFLTQAYSPVAKMANTIEELTTKLEELEKLRRELTRELMTQNQSSALKAQAHKEAERGDFEAAKKSLKEIVFDSPQDASSAYHKLGKIAKSELDYNGAFKYFQTAIKLDPENSTLLTDVGEMAGDLARYDESIDFFKKVVTIEMQKNDKAKLKSGYNNLGTAYLKKGDHNKAIKYYKKALDLMLEEENEGPTFANLGLAYLTKGDDVQAMKYFQKAIDIAEISKLYQFYLGQVYNNIAAIFQRKNDYKKSIDYLEKALAYDEEKYGKNHPEIAVRYDGLGIAYSNLHMVDKAIDYHQKALSIFLKVYGEIHPDTAICYNNLGYAYSEKADYEFAIAHYQKALTISRQFHNDDHYSIGIRYQNLASAYSKKGDIDEAISLQEKALSIYEKVFNGKHPYIAEGLVVLGSFYQSNKNPEKAVDFFLKAVVAFEKLPPLDYSKIATLYIGMGVIFLEEEKLAEAVEYYNTALSILKTYTPLDKKLIKIVEDNIAYALNKT